ncbi:MAG TPA: DUF6328 family protein [Stellaceae bacterium]|jgi:hypothetical protein|nr:DUF6328 family protein [Stellaceae bacterium]HEX3415023.1 DUF6328 family protein [Stellaceae bacterium]
MKLSDKVKVALEETRILILGAQILLGFGFRGVFEERFDQLPAHARYADAVALGLLVCAIGLLIAPGPYHRIVEGGQDSGGLHWFATVIADLSLLPFALALGLGLFVGTQAIFDGSAVAVAAGITGAVVALALWYGLPQLRKRFVGERERMITRGQSHERADTPLQVKIEQLLTEARVILPGAQALFGFQLAIVLTQAFEQLPKASIAVHAASLFLVALAVMMLMAPAPYHRIVYAGEDTEDMYRVGSALVTGAILPLGLGLAGNVYVVIAKISGSFAFGSFTGGLASCS